MSAPSLLGIHDDLLLQAPEDARHDEALCPFCTDWKVDESGIPSGFDRLDLADSKSPYGDVDYADPGILDDGIKRFPLDTLPHAQAAWTFIHQASVADQYSADDLADVRVRISKALEQFGQDQKDQEIEHTKKLAEAKNAGKPVPGTKPNSSSKTTADAASEGGTNKQMDTPETVSKETHEALLDKAVKDATAEITAERDALKAQVDSLTSDKAAHETELSAVKTENERLNGELDTAQVSLKAAQDEATQLKADIASRDDAASKAQTASERAAQVRNLGLFPEDYINDKAEKWAEVDEASWEERLDDWKALKGTGSSTTTSTTDTASAMTGTRDAGAGHEPSARRAILGLE